MANALYRVSTANQYDSALRNVGQRQNDLTSLQEKLTAGKRVVRASDDPVAAAQAERAMTRIERVQTEQRALELQRNAIAQAESSLGDAVGLVQELRQLTVNAGSGTLTPQDRQTIAMQIQSLRDQLFTVANRKDTNGLPLFNGLGSALAPFLGPLSPAPDYKFDGLPGQSYGNDVAIPLTLDGDAAFLFQPQRDGVYHASLGNTIPSSRQFGTTSLTTTNPSLVTGDNYQIVFSGVGPGATPGTLTATYTITDTTTAVSQPAVTIPDFPADKPMTVNVTSIPGLSFDMKGTPANGDTINLAPSSSLFSVVDTAVREIGSAANSNEAAQAVGQALANIDRGLERLHASRGFAGELLNRADRITGNQETRNIQLHEDRSRAEDLDMIQGVSDFQNQQVGYEAALKSYSMTQKLSLFNFIS
jgi:flagellar hook-associated protein 3 FlgL